LQFGQPSPLADSILSFPSQLNWTPSQELWRAAMLVPPFGQARHHLSLVAFFFGRTRPDITARQRSLSASELVFKHATMRAVSGISLLQSRNTSAVQASCSSCVPRSPDSAKPAVDVAQVAKPINAAKACRRNQRFADLSDRRCIEVPCSL